MIELFWLLLPIAAFSGWWIGRFRSQHDVENERSFRLPSDYLQGLNFLLNEQPDKAVDLFLRMVEIDSETVETHLALGSLFRRRGEVDRAIRIHQNLIARPNLSSKQRYTALYHLGLDYMSAGVLDRAENLFTQLLASEDFKELSLLQLADIYQQQHDWAQAIKMVEQLSTQNPIVVQKMLVNMHCELVEEARHKGAYAQAQKLLKKAVSLDAKHIRVRFQQALLASDNEQYKVALRLYSQLIDAHPELIPITLKHIAHIFKKLDTPDQFVLFLHEKAASLKNEAEIALLLNVLFLYEKDIVFIEKVLEKIKNHANLWTLRAWLLIFLERSANFEHQYLKQLNIFVEQLMKEKAGFQCRQCGFSGHVFYWQCPSCKSWDTVKPVPGSLLFDLPDNQ